LKYALEDITDTKFIYNFVTHDLLDLFDMVISNCSNPEVCDNLLTIIVSFVRSQPDIQGFVHSHPFFEHINEDGIDDCRDISKELL
jgi:hypothetical protein